MYSFICSTVDSLSSVHGLPDTSKCTPFLADPQLTVHGDVVSSTDAGERSREKKQDHVPRERQGWEDRTQGTPVFTDA